MAISHVGTNHATSGSGTSVTCTKPSGTTSEDLLLAFFTSNNQNASPPSGWTEIADETVEVFRCQVFYKVAGGSEPSNYQFSVGSAAPLVLSITCLREIDSSTPIDIAASAETDLTHSEPYTTPGLTGGTAGRLVYFRSVRVSSSTPPTFTASGVTELKDVGVFSGGSVSYSQGLYLANSDYSGGGSKSGLAITCSGSDTHNFVFTVGIRAEAGVTGTFDVSMPSIPSVSMTANWAYAASLSATMLLPTMTSEAFSGNFEGPLGIAVPIAVTFAGHTDVRGTLDVIAGPIVEITGETRFFADNVVIPDREERWFVMTQDGYYLGIRSGVDLPMRVDMPLPVVNFVGNTATFSDFVSSEVTANDASVATSALPGAAAAASVVTEDVTMLNGVLAFAEWIFNVALVDDDQVNIILFGAESVSASAEALNLIGFSATAEDVASSVTAYGATVGNAKNAAAGHASASVVATSIETGINEVHAGHASVSVATNAPTEKVVFSAGHAAVTCHN